MVLQKYQKKFYNRNRFNIEFIKRDVDDFSNDGTWEWMNSVCLLDPNVKIHRNPKVSERMTLKD